MCELIIYQRPFASILVDFFNKKISGHSKKRPKIGFQDRLSLNAGQKYCILQYTRPSLSYHLSLRHFFCLFLSGRFTQVLLY